MKRFWSTNETRAGRSHEREWRGENPEPAVAYCSGPWLLRTEFAGTAMKCAGKYPGGVWYGAHVIANATREHLVSGQQLLSRSARVGGQVAGPRTTSRVVS